MVKPCKFKAEKVEKKHNGKSIDNVLWNESRIIILRMLKL